MSSVEDEFVGGKAVGFGRSEAQVSISAERTSEALVVELLPSALIRVRLEGEHQVIAHLPSTQSANFMRLRVGDRVRVALSAHDRTRGRIVELLSKRRMP